MRIAYRVRFPFSALLFVSICISVGRAEVRKPLLLRNPSLSKTQIAFSYAGNIWIANRDGSTPRRLTSGGHDGKPFFSPDGTVIAFTRDCDYGTFGGLHSGSIYVIPVAGGTPRQLTYHPADLTVVGWVPNGKSVLFSSRRNAFNSDSYGLGGVVQLFTISAEGGPATQVPLDRAAEGSLASDGTHIAYVPHVRWEPNWKRYRGGQTTPIWIADLSDSHIEATIPRENSNDSNPMWVGDTVYFLSDRNGAVTLFAYDTKSHQVRQIVDNQEGPDIKAASASPDAIAYEKFGSLHVLDLASGIDRALDIQPLGEMAEVQPHFEKVEATKVLRSAALSPTGDRVAFGIRGEILTAATGKEDIRNLTETPGVVERDPAWSPAGRSIAYFSDESGECALHIKELSSRGDVSKINLGNPPTYYYFPLWSPDSKKLGYTDKRLNYWYVDVDKKTPVRVDADLFTEHAHRLQLAWSPDSRWIAYTKQLPSHFHAVFLYSLDQAKSYQLTDGLSDALYVAFDKNGKYLYFTASTDVALSTGWQDLSTVEHPITRSVYIVLLQKNLPSPLAPHTNEEEGKNGTKAANGEEVVRLGIDMENISERILALPIPGRNYYGLFAGKTGVLFLIEGTPVDLLPSDSKGPVTRVSRFDLHTQKTEPVLDSISDDFVSVGGHVPSFALSFDGEKLLYADGDRWFVAPTDRPREESRAQGKESPVKWDSMEIYVDPRAEWKHMFDQVWRNERDFFYDPGLHGLTLESVKKRYAPYLENLSSRDDLYYLFGEMLGNMTVGHIFAGSADSFDSKRNTTGLLGADYSVENGRYRITHVYRGDPWDPAVHAPLIQPGEVVEAGEYLLAVNGREVRSTADIYSYFEKTAGKPTMLTVGPKADGAGARQVTVIPVEDESSLRIYSWVEGNRRKVEQLSGGRVAYIYLPDTGTDGYQSFNRAYFAQIGKDAAIIDERYNGGGLLADYFIDYLRRPLMHYIHEREGQDYTTPQEAIFGPKVMIVNEMAGSGGDDLPWMFRKASIGPLVGERTWGGLVGHYTIPRDLLDGSIVGTPNLAFYSPDGTWDIENHGVSPDIEVQDDPKAAREGHDRQLEKAVEVVLDLLKKNPPPAQPHHPPFPNYQRTELR
jgi:tricorn protease